MKIDDHGLDDTDSGVRDIYYERLASMSAGEKIQRMAALSGMAAAFVRGGVKERYPHDSERQLMIRFAAVAYGRDFVMKYFNWDPEVEGY